MKLIVFILISASGRRVGGVKGSFWQFGRTLMTPPPSPPTHDDIDPADDDDGDDDYIDAWVGGDDDADIGIGVPPPPPA